jgi:hypothetical protein
MVDNPNEDWDLGVLDLGLRTWRYPTDDELNITDKVPSPNA